MQWKHWLTMPGEGSLWVLRHAGKWLQDAGQMELSQWIGDIEPTQLEQQLSLQQDNYETELPMETEMNLQ